MKKIIQKVSNANSFMKDYGVTKHSPGVTIGSRAALWTNRQNGIQWRASFDGSSLIRTPPGPQHSHPVYCH